MTVGDTVKIRGGDRSMAIVGIVGENVDCAWYEGDERVEAEFHIDCLVRIVAIDFGGPSRPSPDEE
jgi:uncharacterized protein YodC (DUF2158 family)